jgi:hypothetical protein
MLPEFFVSKLHGNPFRKALIQLALKQWDHLVWDFLDCFHVGNQLFLLLQSQPIA